MELLRGSAVRDRWLDADHRSPTVRPTGEWIRPDHRDRVRPGTGPRVRIRAGRRCSHRRDRPVAADAGGGRRPGWSSG